MRRCSSKRVRSIPRFTGWSGAAGSRRSGARPSSDGGSKLYRLTSDGRKQLAAETAVWRQFSAGVSKILLAR